MLLYRLAQHRLHIVGMQNGTGAQQDEGDPIKISLTSVR
jgi:hypothetical protein